MAKKPKTKPEPTLTPPPVNHKREALQILYDLETGIIDLEQLHNARRGARVRKLQLEKLRDKIRQLADINENHLRNV